MTGIFDVMNQAEPYLMAVPPGVYLVIALYCVLGAIVPRLGFLTFAMAAGSLLMGTL